MIPLATAPVTRYTDFVRAYGTWRDRRRNQLRDGLIWVLSAARQIPRQGNWVRFPYYHHVFDDERQGFAAQLRYLRQYGEFISLDEATTLLEGKLPVDGRYFCLTFDDGFKNSITNAMPILLDLGIRATFFLPTRYINTVIGRDDDLIRRFYRHGRLLIEFLSWDDCRQMAAAGMGFGSHTASHAQLMCLDEGQAMEELRESKQLIEQQVGIPCQHFCVPFGRPGVDFDPNRDPDIARRLAFRSFSIGRRGSHRHRPDPMWLERDLLIAAWGNYQLRYFFSR